MPTVSLFPFGEYWWFYAGFTVFVGVLLALDLGVFHRKAHEVSFKEAGQLDRRLGVAGPAVLLRLLPYMLHAFPNDPRFASLAGLRPRAGRAHERARVPGRLRGRVLAVRGQHLRVRGGAGLLRRALRKYQHRVLFFGILGALFFRAIFIALGAVLLQFTWVIWIFGVFLVFTGVRMMFAHEKAVEPEENAIIRLFKRFVPVTDELDGQRFFVHGGRRHATRRRSSSRSCSWS